MKPILRIIDNPSEFENLRNKWNDLLKKSEADTIFLTWEWMYTWWECFGENKRLFIVVAEEKGILIGIAPLHITQERFFGLSKYKHLEFLGASGVITEYTDFIVMKDHEKKLIPIFFDYLFEYSSWWDILNLTSIKQDSTNLKIIKEYCSQMRLQLWEHGSNISPYIELPQAFDEYMQSLSRDSRWRFRKFKKDLENGSAVDLLETRDEVDVDKDFKTIMDLHQKRWEDKDGKGSFHVTRIQYIKFHKKIVQRFFNNGWLYLLQLIVDNEPVAGQYNFFYKDTVYYHSVGFDPKWNEYNVGNVLQLLAIEDSIAKGAKEFDFLRGTEQYKYRWTKKDRTSLDFVIWKNSVIAKRVSIERKLRKVLRILIPKNIVLKLYNLLIDRGT